MKKEKKKIIINKDNYKGYVELYKAYYYPTKEEFYLQKKEFKKAIKVYLIGLGIAVVTSPLCFFGPIAKMIFDIQLTTWLACLIGTGIVGLKEFYDLKKQRIKAVRKKYPYVDTNVKRDCLQKSLEDVGIIQYKFKNRLCFAHLKVEEYEKKYSKAEEVKENYFKETKYDKYVVNPRIEEQELEKVKVKVKSLTR